jgi:hypothetical protein
MPFVRCEDAKRRRLTPLALDVGTDTWLLGRWTRGGPTKVADGATTDDPAQVIRDIAAALAEDHAFAAAARGDESLGCAFAGAVDLGGVVTGWPAHPSWAGFRLAQTLKAFVAGGGAVVRPRWVCAAAGEALLGTFDREGIEARTSRQRQWSALLGAFLSGDGMAP